MSSITGDSYWIYCWQDGAVTAKKKAEQAEANASKIKKELNEEKEKIKQEYISRLRDLEIRSNQAEEDLTRTQEELARKQLKLENEIDRELGLDIKNSDEFEKAEIDSKRGSETYSMYNESAKKTNQSSPTELGRWKQLKRVFIPVFTGNKSQYENWKAAFTACIDRAPATPEYKLLQLRQYLSGEALKVIENLGHSATAYEAAKGRLERKYGGKRRKFALYLEEIENLKPLRHGVATDVEKFADVLDVAVINLMEQGGTKSLEMGHYT